MKLWRVGGRSENGSEAPVVVNQRLVTRALRQELRPQLRDAGFTTFTDRKAWREREHTIDHVALRSFSAYNAGVLGCTTYSLTVEVGVFYRCLNSDLSLPQDYDCTFRAILGKSFPQPYFATELGPAKDRPDILYVRSDGSNLTDVVSEAKNLIHTQGLPFLGRFGRPEQAFEGLMTERMDDGGFNRPITMFPGNPGSPGWREAAISIGGLIMDDPRAAIWSAPVLRH